MEKSGAVNTAKQKGAEYITGKADRAGKKKFMPEAVGPSRLS